MPVALKRTEFLPITPCMVSQTKYYCPLASLTSYPVAGHQAPCTHVHLRCYIHHTPAAVPAVRHRCAHSIHYSAEACIQAEAQGCCCCCSTGLGSRSKAAGCRSVLRGLEACVRGPSQFRGKAGVRIFVVGGRRCSYCTESACHVGEVAGGKCDVPEEEEDEEGADDD